MTQRAQITVICALCVICGCSSWHRPCESLARMTRHVRDQYLPPDHDAFVAADPPTGRVIVIAPTRAACETIELALHLNIETYLERTNGRRVRELAASGKGFGIVAGKIGRASGRERV